MTELAEFGYLGLLIASFLAATILPFSSEALLSLLLYNGFSIELCVVYASIGNWLGGMSCYGLGRIGRLDKIERLLKIDDEKINRFSNRINRFGGVLAFFCWLPFIGDILAVSLGYFKSKLVPVSIWMLMGKTARYIVWAVATLYFINK